MNGNFHYKEKPVVSIVMDIRATSLSYYIFVLVPFTSCYPKQFGPTVRKTSQKNERAMKPLHKLDNFAQQNAGDTSMPSQNSWRILILLMSEMSVFWMKFHWNEIPLSVYFKSASNNKNSFAPNRRGAIAWISSYYTNICVTCGPSPTVTPFNFGNE